MDEDGYDSICLIYRTMIKVKIYDSEKNSSLNCVITLYPKAERWKEVTVGCLQLHCMQQ